jgi:hypothetical protein
LFAFKRRVDQLGQLRLNPLRQDGFIGPDRGAIDIPLRRKKNA